MDLGKFGSILGLGEVSYVDFWFLLQGLCWSFGATKKVSAAYPPSFYMHLKDPPTHQEMIEALGTRLKQRSAALEPSLAPSSAQV